MADEHKRGKAHVAQYKKDTVADFVKLMRDYPIVAAVNMENMPAPQLQKMRATLRATVVLRMTKRRLIKLAIDQVKNEKKGIELLLPYLKGMPAILFTKDNPFKLYRILSKNKSNAPAKAGQTAPKDIIVKAGPTPFAPGPVIGELGAVGIKTGVEGGKVVIKADSLVVKEGQVIKANAAAILARLGVEPMEVGLDLVAAYENGLIFGKDVMGVDEETYKANLLQAHTWAFNLAVEAGIMNKDTTEFMIQKAFKDSKAVAKEAKFMADAVAEEIVGEAEMQMLALKSELKL